LIFYCIKSNKFKKYHF
jgi:hypothetical protein